MNSRDCALSIPDDLSYSFSKNLTEAGFFVFPCTHAQTRGSIGDTFAGNGFVLFDDTVASHMSFDVSLDEHGDGMIFYILNNEQCVGKKSPLQLLLGALA